MKFICEKEKKMNKALSFTMVLIMLLGMVPTVFAEEISNALDTTAKIDTTDVIEVVEGKINTESDNGFVKHLDSYSTGYTSEDGGVAEIVKYNSDNSCMYLVSGFTQTLDIVKINSDGSTALVKKIDIAKLGEENGFDAGDITSVDVDTEKDIVAIAVQSSEYDKNGTIVTLTYDGDFVAKYEAGVQPDMVVFTHDGKKILTANEGEPRNGYVDAVDPLGSVTIVDLESGEAYTKTFEEFDEKRDELVANGVLLKRGSAPGTDLEPEYIAISADSSTAYVTLQENNSVAAIDLNTLEWKYVKGLGFKDHSIEGNGLDLNKNGEIAIQTEDVYGVYMPDGIAIVEINEKEYLLTANEGDSREWGDYENTDKAPIGGAKKDVEYLISSETDGLDEDKTYLLGARSFAIWDAETLELVFESGDDFEVITAEKFPEYFNSGHNEAGKVDARSNKKGPEPESVAVVEADDKIYAVIGLERVGGIMVYDITDPENAVYADYLNVRDFGEDDLTKAGDLGAEGICTIPAEISPTGEAMVLVANEISGTVTVAQIGGENEAEETHSSMGEFVYNPHWLEKNGIDSDFAK